jgi:hypothetical protein
MKVAQPRQSRKNRIGVKLRDIHIGGKFAVVLI